MNEFNTPPEQPPIYLPIWDRWWKNGKWYRPASLRYITVDLVVDSGFRTDACCSDNDRLVKYWREHADA